jgi:hypothetical protein
MRNDARPIGEDSSLKSGEGSHGKSAPIEGAQPDSAESVSRENQSHTVNREADRDRPDRALRRK